MIAQRKKASELTDQDRSQLLEQQRSLDRINAAIEELNLLIADEDLAEVYGHFWRSHDLMITKSEAAGDYCLAQKRLMKAEAKLRRSRPGSIGTRKAKAKVRAAKRDAKKAEKILQLSVSEYTVTEPQHDLKPGILVPRIKPKPSKIIRRGPDPRNPYYRVALEASNRATIAGS